MCRHGDVADGNLIVLCDRDHEDEVGYHQLYLNPPLRVVPNRSWFCPTCVAQDHVNVDESSEYLPSTTCTSDSKSDSNSHAYF